MTAEMNAIEKVCAVLRALSANPDARLTELSAAARLSKGTLSRILEVLGNEDFVDKYGKRYSLGVEAIAMSASVTRSQNLKAIARPSITRLAQIAEDTAQLSVRSGAEAICIDREIGSFPIKNTYLEIGARRPLGVGAGSLALLAFLPDAEISALLDISEPTLFNYPTFDRAQIERAILESREHGYALSLDVVLDKLGGISVPVRAGTGRTVCSITIAALSDRIREREDFLAETLKREAELLRLELINHQTRD